MALSIIRLHHQTTPFDRASYANGVRQYLSDRGPTHHVFVLHSFCQGRKHTSVCLANHGMPRELISDRDKLFTSHFRQALTARLGVQHRLSTAFHPQTDGQTERTDQTLEKYLRCYVNYPQDDWVQLLPLAQFAYGEAREAKDAPAATKAAEQLKQLHTKNSRQMSNSSSDA